MSHVYRSPSEPGAPQIGDLVVVVVPEPACVDHPTNFTLAPGDVGVVLATDTSIWPWRMDVPGRRTSITGGRWWAAQVRWPTPEEVLAHQLARTTAG